MSGLTKSYFYELYEYTENIQVINTHSHHRKDDFFAKFSLEKIFQNSYVEWCGMPFDHTIQSKERFLNKVRYNSYYVWLERALQELYGFMGPIKPSNWDKISDLIRKANGDPGYQLGILRKHCNYEWVILDSYWKPGSDNQHPEIFAPSFRINSFLYSYSQHTFDHNKNNIMKEYGVSINDLDEYVAFMQQVIVKKKDEGCVALKSALAYDRGLDFKETSKEKAAMVFKRMDQSSPDDIKAFGDYIFFEICKIAAELDLPLQCHTGLGLLEKTNALQMKEVIEKNPDTKFVLFHGGYPWLEDTLALTHYFKNVYPDICWLPLISTSAAIRLVDELIEVGTSDRMYWGCDTWTSEESLGALLAARHVLATVLAAKVQDGYFSMDDAKKVAFRILYQNARELYRL